MSNHICEGEKKNLQCYHSVLGHIDAANEKNVRSWITVKSLPRDAIGKNSPKGLSVYCLLEE